MTDVAAASRTRREAGLALVALLLGGGLTLLAGSRTWTTITVHRTAPLGSLVVDVAGRTLQPAVVGLAVVALAGVVAVLATRGRARTVLGAVLVVVGGLLVWPAVAGFATISDGRARRLVLDARAGVVLDGSQPVSIAGRPIWAVLTLVGAVLVIAGGAVVAARGSRWSGMSARYERPPADGPGPGAPEDLTRPELAAASTGEEADARRARADLALWQSLERGEDPTA